MSPHAAFEQPAQYLPSITCDPAIERLPFTVAIDPERYAAFMVRELRADPSAVGEMQLRLLMGHVAQYAGSWRADTSTLTMHMIRYGLLYERGRSLPYIQQSMTRWLVHESAHAVDPTSGTYRWVIMGALTAGGIGLAAIHERRHEPSSTLSRLATGTAIVAAAAGATYYGLDPRERHARAAARNEELLDAAQDIITVGRK